MKKILLTSLILMIWGLSSVLVSQNKKEYKKLFKAEDKGFEKNYNSIIGQDNEGQVYNSGYFTWNRSEKKFKSNAAKWTDAKSGYHFDPSEWVKPKHAWKYNKRGIFRSKHAKLDRPKTKPVVVGETEPEQEH